MLYHHPYFPTGLNRGAVGLTILLLPALATAVYLRRPVLGAVLAVAVVVVVFMLKATIAKVILPLAVIAGGLMLLARAVTVRTAAVAAVLVVLTAPLTFSQFAEVPGLLDRAYEFKVSLAHRLEIWNFVGRHIAERPVLGWGLDASRAIPGGDQPIRPGENWLPLHPHNAALQLWLELGLPGGALLASFAALFWLRLGRGDAPPLFVAASGGALLAAMIAAFASYDIWHEWWIGALSLMLFLVCVMGSVCRDASRPAAATANPPSRRAEEAGCCD
jgi:O-antigen ligase